MEISEDFEIWTDHQNLQYFRKSQKLNRQQARWMTELGDYHFKLLHKSGKTDVKPDILSRLPDLNRGERDKGNKILLNEEHFQQMEFIFEDLGDDFVKRINTSGRSKDQVVEKGLLKDDKGYVKEDGIVTWQGCLYVPKNQKL